MHEQCFPRLQARALQTVVSGRVVTTKCGQQFETEIARCKHDLRCRQDRFFDPPDGTKNLVRFFEPDALADLEDDAGRFAAGYERRRLAHLIPTGDLQHVDEAHGASPQLHLHFTGSDLTWPVELLHDESFGTAVPLAEHGAHLRSLREACRAAAYARCVFRREFREIDLVRAE